MSEEGAEAAAPAQDQNQGFFTGNIMNFERPKVRFPPGESAGSIESLQKEMWLHLQRKSYEYFE